MFLFAPKLFSLLDPLFHLQQQQQHTYNAVFALILAKRFYLCLCRTLSLVVILCLNIYISEIFELGFMCAMLPLFPFNSHSSLSCRASLLLCVM
jgi:hypothetical protein